jgi:hypothetical protein
MRLVMQVLVGLSLGIFIPSPASIAAGPMQGPENPAVPSPKLEQSALPAAGIQKTLMNVERFGRYSVLAESRQGTALQLVDRMAGPGAIAGSPGEQDGRLDAFLERGQYQIIAHGHERATGTVRLQLRPFAERNLPQPPLLIESKLIEEKLQDFEQISYWLDIEKRQFVLLEAAGRNLSDLRLWKDGSWLMDAQPVTQIIYPKEGQPLFSCRLNVQLDPGLYLLTAYGGPAQPWSEESELHPFYLRRGIPRLGVAGRRRFVVSPFGRDYYLVPGPATYFRLELSEARAAAMQVDWFDPERPAQISAASAEITKKSVPPVAELYVQGRESEDHIVTVTADAGRQYVLQHFELKRQYTFRGSREFWISTIHSGYAADSVDATAIIVENKNGSRSRTEPYRARTLEIGTDKFWHRRVNLLGETTLFLNIADAGVYQLMCSGLDARYKFEPFMVGYSADYQSPQPKQCGETWDLDAGYHVLTIYPDKKGIADLLIRPMGVLDKILDTVGWERSLRAAPFQSSTRFPRVRLDHGRSYTLFLNRQPEVKAGIQLRSLPVDLTDPLYIAQEPGEAVSVPFKSEEPGILRAEGEDGSLLEVSVDGGPWQTSIPTDSELHTAAVRHSLGATAHYTLVVVPRRLDAQTPLPAISEHSLESLPKFPVISEDTPQFGDLQKLQSATYLLRAGKPALYRLQSTGLLATSGNLRSRTNPSFVRKSQNGVGRNFSLQQYLREGDYQVTVKTEGESAGHFGLELSRTAIRNGGFLTSGIPARTTLEPGQAIAYYFIITNPGEFRVHALGEGRKFRCRLEDKDGWPVVAPGGEADVSRYFPPGQYRMVLLPETTLARVVTVIEPTPRQRRYTGHGPHTLRLAEKIQHVWMEPETSGPRIPDQWDFSVPAPLEACVELSGEMQGNLLRLKESGDTTRVGSVMPRRSWKGTLPAGRYRLEVTAMRRNNRAPYDVVVLPTELVAGLRRKLSAPVSVPLSVGKTSLVELSSFGSEDVQARLFDGEGRLIAANDDRPDDWNFQITRALPPGRYRLDIDPAGKEQAETIVAMTAPPEDEQPGLSLPAGLQPVLRSAVQIYPLPSFSRPAFLAAHVDSNENVGLAIEALQDGIWQVLANQSGKSPLIRIPLGAADASKGVSYRLRLWSMDRREMRVGLRAETIIPKNITEAQLASGISPVPAKSSGLLQAAYYVKLNRPGLFQVEEYSGDVCWSGGLQESCRPAQSRPVIAWKDELWVAVSLSHGNAPPEQCRASRLMLSPASSTPLRVRMRDQGSIFCDLEAPETGAVLLLASSREGQPAVQLIESKQPRTPFPGNTAIALRGSASVLLHAREQSAKVWAATPEGAGVDVQLRPYYFRAIELRPWTGAGDGSMEGMTASGFSLSPGSKRIHLALGNATVAVLSKGTAVESVHWQGGDSFHASMESSADCLTLFHTRLEEDRYSIEVIPLNSEELQQPLALGSPYERNHVRSGIERLTVAAAHGNPGAPVSLHVRGAAGTITFAANNGRVLRGKDLEIPMGGGILEIAHEPGLLLCWLDQAGSEAQGLWPAAPDAAGIQPVSIPAVRKLRAAREGFRFETDTPILLRVRTASPSISLLKTDSEAPLVDVHPDYTLMDAYLPTGTSRLFLRALGGGTLSDSVEFTADSVTPIGEGLGPEVLLAPGDSRLFSFEVRQTGPVGIGVRASADVVEAELLSTGGKSLGAGTVRKLDLEPGTYLLAIRAPALGAPVRARPAVVGIEPPGTDPPEDVIRKYLEAGSSDLPFSGGHP